WMPKLEAESEVLQVKIMTRAEVTHAKEALQHRSLPSLRRRFFMHDTPDPIHQKEVYSGNHG
ncbi:hypothetical protein KI387_034717, partial [Taxus chinensis]